MTAQTKTTWQKVKLGDVLNFKYGFSLPAKKRIQGDFPVYGSSGIDGWHNEAKVEGEGIIVGRKGNVGATYYSEQSFFPIDTVYYVDELKKAGDLKFFYYLLKRIPFKRIGSDVGVPGLNRDLAYGLAVTIPTDKDEQKHIASILSAFDDKIELNNKINRTLEQMAQAIFKEWFVLFRFPGYKKVKLVESEIGRIPEEWGVKQITKIIKRLPVGKKYDNNSALPKGKVPILDQGNSGYIGFHNDNPGVRASIDMPVAVFTNHTCNYRLMVNNFSCIQNVLPYIGIDDYPTIFIYYLTRNKIKMQEYKGHWPEFEQQVFVVPPSNLSQKYTRIVQPFIKKMDSVTKENQSLVFLRDLLLPKLMSGRIRI